MLGCTYSRTKQTRDLSGCAGTRWQPYVEASVYRFCGTSAKQFHNPSLLPFLPFPDTTSATVYLHSLLQRVYTGDNVEITSAWLTQQKTCCCGSEQVILLPAGTVDDFTKPIWVLQPHDVTITQPTQCEGINISFCLFCN